MIIAVTYHFMAAVTQNLQRLCVCMGSQDGCVPELLWCAVMSYKVYSAANVQLRM